MIARIIFLIFLIAALGLFTFNARKVWRNIKLGLPASRSGNVSERLWLVLKVAFGQTKMVVRPVPGILHFIVYAGFIIINIEVLEILIDGLFGTHRVFEHMPLYTYLIGAFEVLALAVLLSCVIFLIRRNVLKLKRFSGKEMKEWPKTDANLILITEVLLMSAFLIMNAADGKIMALTGRVNDLAGAFPVSHMLLGLLPNDVGALTLIERGCWWFHIIGIFAFLNYLPYSKHFHILLAFPNVYFTRLAPKEEMTNMPAVQNEVKAMLDPSFTPPETAAGKFGARDATDLTWVQLLNAYTCTECGRCTSVCPANITGKALSPRKIMMDTRDRITEIGKNIDKHGEGYDDGKALLGDYITPEEIWACTTCAACVQACPVNIDPLAIIADLRRYASMEEASAPASLNNMFTNIENNGAAWKYSAADRFNWANGE